MARTSRRQHATPPMVSARNCSAPVGASNALVAGDMLEGAGVLAVHPEMLALAQVSVAAVGLWCRQCDHEGFVRITPVVLALHDLRALTRPSLGQGDRGVHRSEEHTSE